MQNKAKLHIRSQKTEVRMQKKINMYKSLFNKEIQTLSIGRFPLTTLSKLSRIGSKTKPKQTQTKPISLNAQMNIKPFNTRKYAKKQFSACEKTKPIQSQSVARPSWPCFNGLEAHATFAPFGPSSWLRAGQVQRQFYPLGNKANFGLAPGPVPGG